MLDLSLTIEGITHRIEDEAKWQEVAAFVNGYFRLTKPNLGKMLDPELSENFAGPKVDNLPIGSYNAPTTQPAVRRSWPERAWVSLGRTATGEEVYREALRLGFKPTAGNPLSAFKTTIRGNPNFIRVGTADNGAALWHLKNAGIPPSAVRLQSANAPQKTVADFARTALEKSGRPLPVGELIQAMFEAGWQTLSKNPGRLVDVTLYSEKETMIKTDNLWGLKEWRGSERLVPSNAQKSFPDESNDEDKNSEVDLS